MHDDNYGMSKRKRSSRSIHQTQGRVPPPDQQQVGLRAFHSGRFDAAIAAWSPLAHNQPRVAAALAEAYFRHALMRPMVADQIADLRQAVALAADEPRYQYHLGLALHRT